VTESSPLLHGFARDDVAIWRDDGSGLRAITAGAFCGAVQRLSRSLPSASHAINHCEDPLAFLLASAAALTAGQTLVLPQSRASHASAALCDRFPDAYCLSDASVPAEPAVRTHVVAYDDDPEPGLVSWPPPQIPRSHVAAILFTSGTTGTAQPHAKTWSSMVIGAGTFAATFGKPGRGVAIVGTVAPQHMFGLETTVVAPWQCGCPVIASRPRFPADVRALLARAAGSGIAGAWLMTTPLQLRGFHAALDTAPPGLQRVIVSTMPLPRDLAQAVERDWRVTVDEIYGCTEGGLLAARRAAIDTAFTPAAGIAFAIADDGAASVSGGQLDAPLRLCDRLRWLDDAGSPADKRAPGDREPARFELVGRDADMVKIAGKRTTVAALTAQLLAVPGVDDGAFFVPSHGAPRMAAVAVAASHSVASLRSALAERIDPAFMPRPLVLTHALPRDPQGKLPLAALAALAGLSPPACGRTTALDAQRWTGVHEASCTIGADHPALPGHFPGRPIVPGVVLLDRIDALLRDRGLQIAECVHVKFIEAVAPLEPLALRVEIDGDLAARFTIHSASRCAVSGSLRCIDAAAQEVEA
jgi:acyl-CoA synthetase (AMP-forming)/AMP-acid ligase II/3-hydroxymyristoyl/3-hydroxydecanoyl-(acyl carrier protein) dehydratase